MEIKREQQWYVLQAIEDRLFKLDFQIRTLEGFEQTQDTKYHLGNVKKDKKVLREVRDLLQLEIEMSQ